MKTEKDYLSELADIRAMMERSAKFMSLSGWAGIMAGIYALAGGWFVAQIPGFSPHTWSYAGMGEGSPAFDHVSVVLVFAIVLALALGTAILDSYRKARHRHEKAWNATSQRMLKDMAVPLVAGGTLALILIFKGAFMLVAPSTLLFYGLALFNAGRYTYREVKMLSFIEIALGLAAFWFVEYGWMFWLAGFGAANIVYGVIMHFRYKQ